MRSGSRGSYMDRGALLLRLALDATALEDPSIQPDKMLVALGVTLEPDARIPARLRLGLGQGRILEPDRLGELDDRAVVVLPADIEPCRVPGRLDIVPELNPASVPDRPGRQLVASPELLTVPLLHVHRERPELR